MFTGPGCQDQGSANTLLMIRPFMGPFSSTGACLHECLRGPSPGPDSTLPLILTSMTKKHNVWGWRHGQPHEHNMISARSLCPLVTQIRGLLLGVEDIEIRAPTLMTWRDRPRLFNWTKSPFPIICRVWVTVLTGSIASLLHSRNNSAQKWSEVFTCYCVPAA